MTDTGSDVGHEVSAGQRATEEQAALRRVATLVARAVTPEVVFAAVAEEAGRLMSSDIALIARYGPGRSASGIVGWRRDARPATLGKDIKLGGRNVASMVFESGRPARVDHYDPGATGQVAGWARQVGIRSSVGVPIMVEGQLWGVMTVSNESDEALPPDAEERLAGFTDLAATAIANAEAREELRRVAEEQAALRRVATLVAREVAPEQVFAAIAEDTGRLSSADTALIGRYGPGPTVTAVVGWRRDGQPVPLGTDVRLGGQNVMSLVFSTRGPVRLEAYSTATGDLAEFAHAAGVGSAVGVPIEVGGRLWGVMMVSLEQEQPWPPGTEERLANFTDLAATAIANAQAREELRHFADEQTALRRVATLVAHGAAPAVVFGAVAEEVGKVLRGVDMTLVGRYTPDASVEFVGGWSRIGEASWVGRTVRIGGHNVTTAVLETEQPARVDQLQDDATEVTSVARRSGARSSAGAPITVDGQLWGVITVGSAHEQSLPVGIEHALAGFTELVATAIANADGRAQLVAARRRVIEATDAARAKVARDIHDGAQQQFLTAFIDLQLAQQKRASDPSRSAELVDLAAEQVETGIETLRELAAGVHPAVLSFLGLRAALEALAARLPLPLSVAVDDVELPTPVQASVYFFCSEALTNVVKHADAHRASVRVTLVDCELSVEVRDDGVGGAEIGSGGTGLIGLHDRIGALEGSLHVSSPSGGGTTLLARIPLSN